MSARDPTRPKRIPAYPLLDGHVRAGKKLISPLKSAISDIRMVSTLDAILPELIWIGGVFEVHGVPKGIEIVSEFLKSLWSQDVGAPPEFFRLSVLAKREYTAHVCGAKHFERIELVFATVGQFYGVMFAPECKVVVSEPDAAVSVEKWVKKYWNRFEQPFLLAAGTVIYSLALADRMKFAEGTAPNLEAIATDFGSSDADRASAFVRSSMLAFFPQSEDERASLWCRSFWERNYSSTECQIDD